jgi:adenylylsulfate kinase
MKLLICGRSQSGKTFFANYLKKFLDFSHFNGDFVRELTCNNDFTMVGRVRQSFCMKLLAENCGSEVVVCDFICPTKELRKIFAPDIIVYCSHLGSGQCEDTDSIFEPVENSEAAKVFVLQRGGEEKLASLLKDLLDS